jgi:hypothetical protein
MDDGSPRSDEPRPGPIVCRRCGTTWGGDAGFLPDRAIVLDGLWSWLCVDCVKEAADVSGGDGQAQSPEKTG